MMSQLPTAPIDLRTSLSLIGVLIATGLHFGGIVSGESNAMHVVVLTLLVIGMVHGGFDVSLLLKLARATQGDQHIKRAAMLFAGYVIVAVIGYLLYRSWPAGFAWLFLALSAWHFAISKADLISRACSGVLLLAMPLIQQPAAFQYLATSTQPPRSVFLVCFGVAAIVLALAWLAKRTRIENGALMLIWLGAGALIEPLLWFVCFFVFEHSTAHVRSLQHIGLARASDLTLALLAAIVTICFAAIFTRNFQVALSQQLPTVWMPLLFGLTIAHSTIVDFSKVWRDEKIIA